MKEDDKEGLAMDLDEEGTGGWLVKIMTKSSVKGQIFNAEALVKAIFAIPDLLALNSPAIKVGLSCTWAVPIHQMT